VGNREPGQGLGDLRPESAHTQHDVEAAAYRQPGAAVPRPVCRLYDCGSLDPWLKDQTRVAEKRYKELGGKITVLVTEGEGHFPVSRKDPKPVMDFILSHQR